MDAVETIVAALARTPEDETGWLALADSLDESGQDARAELVRVQLSLRRDPEGDPSRETRLVELWRQGTAPCLPTRPGPAGMDFVLVPPGDFLMGGARGRPVAGRGRAAAQARADHPRLLDGSHAGHARAMAGLPPNGGGRQAGASGIGHDVEGV